MMHNLPLPLPLPLTLAAWDDYIWLMLVGATVIGSWISNMKKKGEAQRKRDEGPASMEQQEVAARRREQLREASRSRVQASQGGSSAGYSAGGGSSGGEPGNLTMAERIARARAKAQYEQRAQGSVPPAQRSQPQVPNEAQRRALAQRQAELQRRQQVAQVQANQRAQQQAQQQARLQAQQQRAQAQARQRGVLLHDHTQAPGPTESTTRRLVPSTSTPKRPPSPPAARPAASRLLTSASLSRDDLRRAIVLNEVLGKPVALRDEAGFSY